VMDRQLKDGNIVHGPAVPTLAEFCTKHSSWFSTDVDVRLLMLAAEMVATVHRVNEGQAFNVQEAQAKAPSQETKDKMKNL
jgi:hypothetical protein